MPLDGSDEGPPRVQFAPPSLDQDELDAIADVLASGWLSTGPICGAFEEEFAAALGADDALALNSCTAGLHTALQVLGVGPGDEVITTTLTFAATANVIEHSGARTVLVDVLPETLNMDPERVAAAITERTRAIIVVHFGGHPADMDAFEELAARHGLDIIEDAAHALPARYYGRTIGSGSNLTAFSFYATKNLATGEGGMLTGPRDLIDKARPVSLHGMTRAAWARYREPERWRYEIVVPGFKYNMSDIQAAIGRCQLAKLPRMQARRQAIVESYDRRIPALEGVTIPRRMPWVEHAYHLYPILVDPERTGVNREEVMRGLDRRNIATSVHFIPVHSHPYYIDKYGLSDLDFPVASRVFERILSLPLSGGMSDQDAERVMAAVEEVITRVEVA